MGHCFAVAGACTCSEGFVQTFKNNNFTNLNIFNTVNGFTAFKIYFSDVFYLIDDTKINVIFMCYSR